MAFEKVKQYIINKLSGSNTSGTGYVRPVAEGMKEFDKAAMRSDRGGKIQDCTEMAEVDPRIARMLRKLKSDSCVGGLAIHIESAPDEATEQKAQEIIDDLFKRCKILRLLKGWVKACIRDGDLFLEVIVDDKTGDIVRLKKLAPNITWSSENSEGNFPEDEPAYYQAHPWQPDEKIKTFEKWQIIHIKWDEEDGKPYGTALFAPGRLTWKRVDGAEKAIVARRQINGMKIHHKIGSPERPDWEQVNKYKIENQDTIDHPLDPVANYFTTGNVEIKEIAADKTIGDMEDVKHLEGLLFALAGIPPALFGGGNEKNVNRDVLDEMEEDYYRVLEDIDDSFEAAFREIIDFALLLKELNPDALEYTFNWGAKDRDDIESKITRGEQLQKLGFSFETIFATCDLDGITYEDEIERIKNQVAEGIVPYGIGTKLDPMIAQLLLGVASQKPGNEGLTEEISKLRELAERQLGPGDAPLKVIKK